MEVISNFQHFKCSDGRTFYTCFINQQDIDTSPIKKSIGDHALGHSDKDVTVVIFQFCNLTKVPKGVTKIFPNMEDLSIWHSNLQSISKDELHEYKHLKRIAVCNCGIRTLLGDLFSEFRDLEEISFSGNKLTLIDPDILVRLDKLKFVSFENNPNYNQLYSMIAGYASNVTLGQLKYELHKKFNENPANLGLLTKFYKDKITDLKRANENLVQQNEELKLSGVKLNQQFQKFKIDILQNELNNEIKTLINDNSLKDFKIIIGDHEFVVHKFLLIARSPTLADILRNNPYVENLNLIDIPVEIFEKVLNFIYSDELPSDDKINFLQLFAAAGRLKINKLKEYAASKILNQINPENALEVFKLSNRYDHSELRNKSFTKIKDIYSKMKFLDEWAFQTEQVNKAIELFKEKEEAIRKIEENFWNQLKTK